MPFLNLKNAENQRFATPALDFWGKWHYTCSHDVPKQC